jgi:glucose dehydrogenase
MKNRIRVRTIAVASALALASVIPAAQALAGAGSLPRHGDECCSATGANAPMVGGDYGNQDYSSLAQITPGNVRHLAGTWLDHLAGGATSLAQESTPVAVDGQLFVQTGQGDVLAINGATGQVIWDYKSGSTGTERGVAVAAALEQQPNGQRR